MLGDARSFLGLPSKIPLSGSVLNFEMTARHQCGNRCSVLWLARQHKNACSVRRALRRPYLKGFNTAQWPVNRQPPFLCAADIIHAE